MTPDAPSTAPSPTGTAERALERAAACLLSRQHEDGHWCAELEGDSILQSEYLLMVWILGLEEEPWFADRIPGIAQTLREQQLESGAWAQYPGGEIGGGRMDLSATVKAYFALKLVGDDTESGPMRRARELILAHGGAERVNSFSKFYLACLGQVSYEAIPHIPPQLIFLPKWFYFHVDKLSAWTRTMIMPLAVVTACRAKRELPPALGIDELFREARHRHRLLATGFGGSAFWSRFFLGCDQLMKGLDRLGLMKLGREAAIRKMEAWMIEHCEGSDGPGAIFPPIVYMLIALCTARGWSHDEPLIQELHGHLAHYMIYGRDGTPRNRPEDASDGTIRIQPCESPTWDTGIAAYALTEAGYDGSHEPMRRCAGWLVGQECRRKADWCNNLWEDVDFSGWFFEYNNPWYPDLDDTVMVSMALHRIAAGGRVPEAMEASTRSFDWIRAMQNTDGGWAAFDRGAQGRTLYEHVPFADHNAMQDPSCPDITGRTLERWGVHGIGHEDPNVARAIRFLRARQDPCGGWFGRWGVNYIYGTWQVVCGLAAVGVDMNEPWVRRAGQWLKEIQQEDGAFGESCDSYEDPSRKGRGPATASQTAWAAMAMMAIEGPEDEAVCRAIAWLARTQRADGDWDEPWFTGTGFPRVFYLRYHFYRLYFPLMALGRWQRLRREGSSRSD